VNTITNTLAKTPPFAENHFSCEITRRYLKIFDMEHSFMAILDRLIKLAPCVAEQ
jgi:hypothetical protein